jgi:glycerol-1-phosphate dehydrogenase [NAD(P)+]
VPVVFGGGTLNDLVKRASHERELPYCCVPTAASVDGFTAFGAALVKDGLKQTLACPAPRALVADTEVLAKAPAYLSSSGFGDLASKIIAATDWIIADKAAALNVPGTEPINEKPWAMVQNGLMDALDRSIDAARGDEDAVSALFGTLAITGFSMQYQKNSRPVSGAEHLFSHVWEMNDLSLNGVSVTHGHKVAIGTLAATAFTELFFADPDGPPPITSGYKRPSRTELEAEVQHAFNNHPGLVSITKTATDKFMTEKQTQALNELFRDTWKDIRERVLAKLLPYSELKEMLGKALCPLTPETIGLSRSEAIATARLAQMIRVKYSILDLAWDMGNFEETLSRLEASPRYLW